MEFKKISNYKEMIEISALAFSFEKKDQGDLEKLLRKLDENGRYFYGVYDEETLVAACVVYPYQMRFRDSIVTMGGIALVCSRQDYRGKGGVRMLLSGTLESLRELGHSVSVLYPFQRDFYRKYGWEIFDRWQLLKFSPGSLRDLEFHDVEARDMAFPDEQMKDFYREYASSHLNYVVRNDADWQDRFYPVWSSQIAKRIVKFSSKGEVVGLMDYSINSDHKDGGYFHTILTFVHKDENARRAMFSYIKGLSHQVSKVHLWQPATFESWPYLSDRPDECTLRETSMIRIVDLMKLSGIRMSTPDLSITMKVDDKQCSWNNGVFTIGVHDGILNVERGKEVEAELEIGIGALSTVIGGRESLSRLIEIGLAKPLEGYKGTDIERCEVFMIEPF